MDHVHLIAVAERCAGLQYDYWRAELYTHDFPIEGIPTLLFPVDDSGTLLVEIVDTRKEIMEDAREGDSLAMMEFRELVLWGDMVLTGLSELGEIRHTLVYESIHFALQFNLLQSNNTGQIYFPGVRIHDLPPINIRNPVDPNWSRTEVLGNTSMFQFAVVKYSLLIDAYKFTYDNARIARARQLSSNPYHPFDPFFLQPRYIHVFRAHLRGEIASWCREHHQYWSVIAP